MFIDLNNLAQGNAREKDVSRRKEGGDDLHFLDKKLTTEETEKDFYLNDFKRF